MLLTSSRLLLAQEPQVVQQQTPWATYTFTIPATHPVDRPTAVQQTPLGPVTINRIMAMNTAFPIFSYQAAIVSYPPGYLAQTPEQEMFLNVLYGVLGGFEEFTALSVRPATVGGVTGIEVDVSLLYLGTRVHARNRLCRVGDDIAMVTFAGGIMENLDGDPTLLDDPSGMAYLDSLTIVPGAPAATVAPLCHLSGTWQGVFPPSPSPVANQPVTFHFGEDGQLTCTAADISLTSSWTAEGNAIHIQDRSSIPPQVACEPAAMGTYAMSFDPECTQVTFSVMNEPCGGRSYSMNHLVLTRM
ncbi:MAG: hypothetical protein JW797_17525 [Bradymonadales bacterium]|nr:hypothetical protein [Bradymonadales bacterium]